MLNEPISETVVEDDDRDAFPLHQLAAKRAELQRDGMYLSNRNSIEIVITRIQTLAERIDQNEAPDRLMRLQKLWEYFKKVRYVDEFETVKTYKKLDAEFEAAFHDYEAWRQMFDAVDLHRRLIESEVKIAKDLKAILTADDAYNLIAELFGVILRIENDPEKLRKYQYEFTKLIGDGSLAHAQGSGEETRNQV